MDIKHKLARYVGYPSKQILEAISTTSMFGNKSGPFMAGAIISTDIAFVQSVDQAVSEVGGYRKDMLYGRLNFVTRTDEELRLDLKKSIEEMARDDSSLTEFRQKSGSGQG